MKEQGNIIEKPSLYPLVCMDCANNLIMDERLLIKREEYERLKKLDDNATAAIENIKSGKYRFIESEILQLLEGLYK